MFAKCSAEDFKSSSDIATKMLKEAHTVVTDGAGFGADGFLRFSYATSMENLDTAVETLEEMFGQANVRALKLTRQKRA